jgi:hypothetical protein
MKGGHMAENENKEVETYSPFHKTIDRAIMQASVGIASRNRAEKITEMVGLVSLLSITALPPGEGTKLAKNLSELPVVLRSVGEEMVAQIIDEVIADLKTR